MVVNAIRTLRGTFRIVWLVITVALFGVIALSVALPAIDRDLYVVTGNSMEPSIPVGSAVVVRHTAADKIVAGDVITFRGQNDTVITHRVLSVVASTTPEFHTKGDASDAQDPFSVSGPAVIGNVEFVVPGAGALLVVMRSTLGALVTIGLIGSLALTIWFMDELLASLRRSASRRAPAAEVA
jgi:signal peptidase